MTLPGKEIGAEFDWLDGLLRRARNHAEHLSDADIRFVDDMTVRADKWVGQTYVSPKQRRWLERIERDLAKAETEEGGWDDGA